MTSDNDIIGRYKAAMIQHDMIVCMTESDKAGMIQHDMIVCMTDIDKGRYDTA